MIVGFAYVPVIHKGYLDFCAELTKRGVKKLYLPSDEMLAKHEELDYIHRKDRLRAIPLANASAFLKESTGMDVSVLGAETVQQLQNSETEFCVPQEDISQFVMHTYFPKASVNFVPVFLRRNKDNVGEAKKPVPNSEITLSGFQREILKNVVKEGNTSADWWRQVGAALVKEGKVIVVAHNEHMPEEQLPNIIGDSRSLFKKGIHINYVTSAHAEVAAIGAAAKEGISTNGAELYVTDFPCPYCARLIVKAGVTKLYFIEGYAVLDGDDFLREAGVELVHVQI